jgi:hypothetical protein
MARNGSQQSMPTALPVARASSIVVSPNPQPTSSTRSPLFTGWRASATRLCSANPSASTFRNRVNFGTRMSFQTPIASSFGPPPTMTRFRIAGKTYMAHKETQRMTIR